VVAAFLSACAKPPPSQPEKPAEVFTATVTKVFDGDTCEVRRADGQREVLRFQGVDAPERDQPFGEEAAAFVRDSILEEDVKVLAFGRDSTSQQRLLAEIVLPSGARLNEELVRRGLAWWFYHYSRDRSLAELELKAKMESRGLFAERNPIYPRNWRDGARVSGGEPQAASPRSPRADVFILAVMPNPQGLDAGAETVILANRTARAVRLDGWSLRDDDGGVCELADEIEASSARTFRLADSLQLGNNGDVVRLVNPSGVVAHALSYSAQNGVAAGAFVVGDQ
jgi:endonuclease YncB( thermonuclease family)